MSYMQFQRQCQDCGEHWNAAFGIVGTTQIATPPTKCPKCGSTSLIKVAEGWSGQSLHATISAYCQGCDELRSERDRALSELAEARKQRDIWRDSSQLNFEKKCELERKIAARAAIPENGAKR